MVLSVFLPSNIHAKAVQSELVEQLIAESQALGLKIDESKIVTYSKDDEGEYAAVPLTTGNKLNVSRKQLDNGEVYVAFQCVKTKKSSDCYKIRLTDFVSKTKNLKTALVDRSGKTIASSEVAPSGEIQSKGIAVIIIWGSVDFYIDGIYVGTYSWVIIIIRID